MVLTSTNKYTTKQNEKYRRYRKQSYNVTWRSKEGAKITFGQGYSGMGSMQEVAFDINSEGKETFKR